MKIKRFFAPDMRQAIRMVREEQGPDAVILSNRRVEGGIEIVAAIDYDESLIHQSAQQEAPAPAPAAAARPAPAPGAAARYAEELPPAAAAPQPAHSENTVRAPKTPAQPSATAKITWSQDPALTEMRGEIKELRGLLEMELARLAWGELGRNQPLRATLLRRMTRLGLSARLSERIADHAAAAADADQAWRYALATLGAQLPVTDDDILNEGGVVALVGPTGVGKTTTVAKLAARFALRHGQRQVALISTDNYRIGAHEQLFTYGRILGIPVHVAADRDELVTVLKGLFDRKLVLIDTAGMSQRDLRLAEQLATLQVETAPIKSYLVLSATTQLSGISETVKSFRRLDLRGCILTKIDETASLGAALSSIIEHRLPVAYVGDGQRVPEDMHPARAHVLINRAVELMNLDEQEPAEESLAMAFGGRAANAHV